LHAPFTNGQTVEIRPLYSPEDIKKFL
jgi:hypothetical protein